MPDRVSYEQRQLNMRRVKGKDTLPEIYLRKSLHARGFRYRICCSKIMGHPDIWLSKYNTAIFVHGCFWHQHSGCSRATIPQTRTDFWKEKFKNNKKRDSKVRDELKKQGIKCLVVWECTIKKMKKDKDYFESTMQKIIDFVIHGKDYLEI